MVKCGTSRLLFGPMFWASVSASLVNQLGCITLIGERRKVRNDSKVKEVVPKLSETEHLLLLFLLNTYQAG